MAAGQADTCWTYPIGRFVMSDPGRNACFPDQKRFGVLCVHYIVGVASPVLAGLRPAETAQMTIAWTTEQNRIGETEISGSTAGLAVRVNGLTGLLTDPEMIAPHRSGERHGLTVAHMGIRRFAWKRSDYAGTHLPTHLLRLPRHCPHRPNHLHPRLHPRPHPSRRRRRRRHR